MRKYIFRIILIALALKLLYFLFAQGVSKVDTTYQTKFSQDQFFSLFKKNDSYWYQKVAETGYPKITNPLDLGYSFGKHFKQSVWAHFPAYPMSIRAIKNTFDLSFEKSAFIISMIFSLTTYIAFFLLCIHVFKLKERESFLTTFLFMIFPFHYYFSMYYTEAMFFTFLAFAFIFIAQKKYLLLSLSLIPLTLVRPNGIACLLPLFIYFIEVEGGFKFVFKKIKSLDWAFIKKTLFFLSAPIVLGIYCLYQKHMTDHYFAFVKAQSGWYKEFMFPFLAFFRRSDITTQFNSIYTIIVMLFCIVKWKKFPLSLNILIWLSMLLPLASGSVACMPRYISTIFPLTIYLASLFITKKWNWIVFVVLIALHFVTFYPWLISHPFSY